MHRDDASTIGDSQEIEGLLRSMLTTCQYIENKHGSGNVWWLARSDIYKAIAVLAEEVGEVCRAAQDDDAAQLRNEIEQVAVTSLLMLHSLTTA